MKPDYQLLDCQQEHGFEPVDPDADRMEYWHDEYGEPHPRQLRRGLRARGYVRRWHSVWGFVLALGEAALLLAVVTVIVALFYVVFG